MKFINSTFCSKKEQESALQNALQEILKDKLNPFNITASLLFKTFPAVFHACKKIMRLKMEAEGDCNYSDEEIERATLEELFLLLKKKNNAKNRRAFYGVLYAFEFSTAMALELPEAIASMLAVGRIVSFMAMFIPKELLVPFGILCLLLCVWSFTRKVVDLCEQCFGFFELKKKTDLDVKIYRLDKKLKRSHRSNYINCNFHGYDYSNSFERFISRRSYSTKRKNALL